MQLLEAWGDRMNGERQSRQEEFETVLLERRGPVGGGHHESPGAS